MDDFPGLPEDPYEYVNRFTYSSWVPGTQLVLVNVPWDSSYRDIVRFDTEQERITWFSNRQSTAIELNGYVYLRYGEPVRISIPFDEATRYNYLVVKNPVQPVPHVKVSQPDAFYYFVTDCTYIAPNTTQLNVQLDVWQTYGYRCVFDQCYVERGHIGIANSNSNRYNLVDYLTDVEGLDVGDEYEIVKQQYVNLIPRSTCETQDKGPWVLVMSSAKLDTDYGTVDNPSLTTASGGDAVGGAVTGASCYLVRLGRLFDLFNDLKDAPWVSQCIQYMTIIPEIMVDDDHLLTPWHGYLYDCPNIARNIRTFDIEGVHDGFEIPNRYRNVLKLLCSPYCYLEITAQCGGEIVAKPECVKVGTDGVAKLDIRSSMCPPDVRLTANLRNYNTPKSGFDTYDYTAWNSLVAYIDRGEGLDAALTWSNFPQLSVVNNMYQYYLAANRNQIAYQYKAADWGQQKAMLGAGLSFGQASYAVEAMGAGMDAQLAYNNAMLGINQMQIAQNAALDAAGSVVGGAASGEVVGAIGGGVGAAIGISKATIAGDVAAKSTGVGNNLLREQTGIKQGQAEYNRDTNYDYAKAAARGDYQLAIQSIQAKVQDAAITQPTTSGQMGGDLFNFTQGMWGILIKWKRIKPNYMRQIGDYFLRYGYYVNRWITPPANLKCCQWFTYWKMQQVSLSTTDVPEVFKQTIRGIFEKGVTVWTNPDNMYRVDISDNEPVSGVSY